MSNEKAKKLALAVAAIGVVLFVLFLLRGKGNTIVSNGAPVYGPNATGVDAISFGPRSPFVIPDFGNLGGWRGLSAIGACCSDCTGGTRGSYVNQNSGGTTIVFNEGQRGNTVYNYTQPTVTTTYRSRMLTSYSWGYS